VDVVGAWEGAAALSTLKEVTMASHEVWSLLRTGRLAASSGRRVGGEWPGIAGLVAAGGISLCGLTAFAAEPIGVGGAVQVVAGAVAVADEDVTVSPDGMWITKAKHTAEVLAAPEWIRPARGRALVLDLQTMMDFLRAAPMEGTQLAAEAPLIVWLPRPDGTFERFSVVESPIMAPELAAMLPGTKTFLGQGLDNPANVVRFDHTLEGTGAGFHALVLSPDGDYVIDPVSANDKQHYASFFRREQRHLHKWACGTQADHDRAPVVGDVNRGQVRAGSTLRTYRMAVACTGEYAAVFGGTVTAAQNEIVTVINRANAVFEREVAVRMILVANNTSVVYTNAATDPYDNADKIQMLNANTPNLNAVIGVANYDIGHVFGNAGGGVAYVRSVCNPDFKGGGMSGSPFPAGDSFAVTIVCHEIGHQFGARHTFNSSVSPCGTNRFADSAMEPGAGSTIMGYGSVCFTDGGGFFTNAYFHSRSFDEMTAFIAGAGGACATPLATGNRAPVLSVGPGFTIPRNTPFTLTATGSDPDGDVLTYNWEERELGPAATLADPDNGTSPNYRSFPGIVSPSRTFPAMSTVLGGPALLGEKVYSVERNPASFRITARDNRAGGGGVNTADVDLAVHAGAGPFTVTAPVGGASFIGRDTVTVTWNVAGTNVAPINTANVRIVLSTNGGATFDTVLAASTPNDGSEVVTLPDLGTPTARIRIEAINNVFFNVNPGGNFSIFLAPPPAPTDVVATPNSGCVNQSFTLTATVRPGEVCEWFINGCGATLVGTGSPLVITPTTPFTDRIYSARARRLSDGISSATCGSVIVSVNAPPVAPQVATSSRNNFCSSDAGNISLSVTGGSGTLLRWSTGACGGTTIGTGNNLSIPSPTETTTYFARWETTCGVSACASVQVRVGFGPLFFSQPLSRTVEAGSPVTFNSSGTVGVGGGVLSYQWRKDGINIPGATGSSYSIPAVRLDDAGIYIVRLTDACGSIVSNNAVLTVTCAADFNDDGFADFFDYLDFVSDFANELLRADFNNDGAVDFFDYLDFVAVFEQGC
jgi:hypothetical protein